MGADDDIANSVIDDNIEYAFSTNTKNTAVMVQQGVKSASNKAGLTYRYEKIIGETSIVEYYGEAICGATTSEPKWFIKKIVSNLDYSSIVVTQANAGASTAIWDNRTSLSYT